MNLVWTSLYVFKWINLTYKLSLSRNGGWPLVEGYELVEYRDPKGRPFLEADDFSRQLSISEDDVRS